jgi:two-component system, OmpR family, sensor histidine kinase BaeS
LASLIRLAVDGKTVGWLGVRAIPELEAVLDVKYLREVRAQILMVAAAAVLLGILASWLLARRIMRPIDLLRAGTRRLASGDTDTRLTLQGGGELDQLTRDFNALAASLGADERARRQWVADTSHELRTPITVLRAEVEAMLDGVRLIDAAAVASLHAELLRLGKLVDDLGELASADRGALVMTRIPVEPVALLLESVAVFRGRLEKRRIAIDLDLAQAAGARVAGDRDRIKQIYANLLENTARYTDDGGTLRITIAFPALPSGRDAVRS